MCLLTIVSNSAMADWTKIGGDDISTDYVNLATIRENGNIVKMWSLANFSNAQKAYDGRSYKSSKIQSEYDCKEEKKRTVAVTNTSQNMGEGEIIFTGSVTNDWSPIVPDSIAEIKWKIACGVKQSS